MAEVARRVVGALLVGALAFSVPDDPPLERQAVPAAEAVTATTLGGAPRPHPANWRRIFNEPFSGTSLEARRWGRCHWWAQGQGGCTIASNHELEWYRPDNVGVAGGYLRLEARAEEFTNDAGTTFPYTSGMISSGPPRSGARARFAFTYGYVEARLRLPAGTGLWPAFWLLPADAQSRPEVDILETLGHEPSVARLHVHFRDRSGSLIDLGEHWEDPALADGGWHRFAVDWRPRELTFVVDGRARWRITGSSVPAEPMYVLLNLAVGGDYPGPPDASTPFPTAVEADWIRVWQARRR